MEVTGSPGMQTTGPASSPGTGAKVWGQWPRGQGTCGAPRSEEEALGEQLSPNGSSRAGFWHPALRGVTVGLFSLWNPLTSPSSPPNPFPDPIPVPQLLSLPPCLSFPCRRAQMEPSCCDPHTRAGLTSLAHLHRARISPPEPLDAPGSCPALSPGPVGSIGVWEEAGPGHQSHPEPPSCCSNSCQTSSPGQRDNSTFSCLSHPCPPLAAKPAAVS